MTQRIGILAQLMEKKDLKVYMEKRIEILKQKKTNQILREHPKRRGLIHQRIKGRILELQYLLHLLHNNTIKSESIRLWRELEEE